MEQIYDLVIIGSGPSGLSCAINAAKAGLEVIVIDDGDQPGGHLKSLESIKDYPPFPNISGEELSSMLVEHAQVFDVCFIKDKIISVDASSSIKTILSEKNEYLAVGVVIATGSPSKYNKSVTEDDADCNIKFPYPDGIKLDENGYIESGEDCRTSISEIYAVGDARKKPLSIIISSINDGCNAVNSFLDDIKLFD